MLCHYYYIVRGTCGDVRVIITCDGICMFHHIFISHRLKFDFPEWNIQRRYYSFYWMNLLTSTCRSCHSRFVSICFNVNYFSTHVIPAALPLSSDQLSIARDYRSTEWSDCQLSHVRVNQEAVKGQSVVESQSYCWISVVWRSSSELRLISHFYGLELCACALLWFSCISLLLSHVFSYCFVTDLKLKQFINKIFIWISTSFQLSPLFETTRSHKKNVF